MESPLHQPYLQCEIISLLTFEDAVRFLSVLKIKTSDCPITITDRYREKLTLPGINSVTKRLYSQIKDNGIFSSFYWSIRHEDLEALQILLRSTISIDRVDNLKESFLMVAVRSNKLKTISFLVRHGANVMLKNWLNNTALHLAVYGAYSETIRTLLTEVQNHLNDSEKFKEFINSSGDEGGTALTSAIKRGNRDAVHILLDFGADVTTPLPLIMAIEFGYNKIVKMLIQAGTNVNQIDPDFYPALISASLYNNPEATQILLEAGADPNIQTADGETALTVAEEENHPEIVKMLLAAGAH